MVRALLIRVRFPGGVYRGGELGRPEELPSPARLHAAFVSAAAGGPAARNNGRVLVACDEDRAAVAWLEDNAPLGVVVPDLRIAHYGAVRHRVRAAVDPTGSHDLHRDETPFGPFSALAAPVVFAWPPAPQEVRQRLERIAREVTHVGQADSIAAVDVSEGEFSTAVAGALALTKERGPGRELRVPEPGRWEALVNAHERACTPDRRAHRSGEKGRQAKDQPVAGAGDQRTRLVRFAARTAPTDWPYAEAWLVPMQPMPPAWALRTASRVGTAVAVHRAIVAAIGDDVPTFITGRDGSGPLRGSGHLAIQFVPETHGAAPALVLGVPAGVPDADRAALLDVLAARVTARIGGRRIQLGEPRLRAAASLWPEPSDVFATAVPMILDASGRPRHGRWTLDDAVVCSVGYALRGLLEAGGIEWGSGWSFRRELVADLRRQGVDARALRVHASASRFAHRARAGDLLIAAHAVVRLGDLALDGRGLLALGRARHLGGGLLRPLAAGR